MASRSATRLARRAEPRSAPRRILHVFGQMNTGGAETRAVELMRYVDPRQCEFHFGVLSGVPGTLDETIRSRGGTLHPIRLGLRFPVRLRTLLREYEFSVVHAHVQLASGVILRQAFREGVPIRIAHFHSSGDGNADTLRRTWQRRALRYLINKYATDIVAVSEATMDAAWGAHWRGDPRCRVILTAVDTERFQTPVDRIRVREELGWTADARIVIHVGSQQPAKNHERLIEIFAALVQRDPSARLLMVGRRDDAIDVRLRAKASERGVLGCVTFAGERRDVPRLLQSANVMVFPSVREGLPGAVLEACAAGLPVVASDRPFMREIAERCSNVRCVSLDASNGEWARTADALEADWRARRVDSHGPAPDADKFFQMDRYTDEWCSVWAVPRGREVS